MFAVLIKASLVIIILLAFYKLVLEKESFFAANRIYLLSCLLLACTLPFLVLPRLVEHQGFIASLLEPAAEIEKADLPREIGSPEKEAHHESYPDMQPFPENVGANPFNPQVLEEKMPDAEALPLQVGAGQQEEKGISFWLWGIYYFGLAILSLRLLSQVGSVCWKVLKQEDKIVDENCVIVNMSGEVEPCSFYKYIFINPSSYDYETYEQILAHEKIHVNQLHTLDILLAEIAVVLLWFNPFIWLLRKEVEKNIEYQTDDILIREKAEEKEDYQMNLVKMACYTKPLTITMNYNQSLIKKRILKMNTKKSNPYSYWKYAFLAPLLLVLMLFLNTPAQMIAQAGSPLLAETAEPFNQPVEDATPIISAEAPDLEPKAEQNVQEIDHEEVGKGQELMLENSSRAANDCGKLCTAIRDEDIATVKELLKKVDPNCVDPDPGYETITSLEDGYTINRMHNRTPLAAAARVGNLEIGKLLFDAGAKVDANAQEHVSALAEAAHEGHIQFVEFLLSKGADVNLKGGGHGTALSAAANSGQTEIVELLLNKGANINSNHGGHGSALNSAAWNGHTETVNLLLSKGADINMQTGGHGSALNSAAWNGHTETVNLLLDKGADVNLSTGGHGSALNSAAWNGEDATVGLLIAKGAKVNLTTGGHGSALNSAAWNGNTSTVELLIAKGADVNLKSGGHGSALNSAAWNGEDATVALLIAKGADVNLISGGHGTALNSAAWNGNLETVKLLVSKGADVNLHSGGHGTARISASRNGHNDVVKYLESKGAK